MKIEKIGAYLVPMILTGFFGTSANAAEQAVRWKPDSLIANGNGCPMGDNIISTMVGDEIQLEFSNMGIFLPANSGLAFAQRKACTISVTVEVPPGFYMKGLHQKIRFGGMKSADASAAIAAQGVFYGSPLKPLSLVLETGSIFNNISATVESEDLLNLADDPSQRCAPTARQNELTSIRLVTQGLRESDADTLILSAGTTDLKYNATLLWEACPSAH